MSWSLFVFSLLVSETYTISGKGLLSALWSLHVLPHVRSASPHRRLISPTAPTQDTGRGP